MVVYRHCPLFITFFFLLGCATQNMEEIENHDFNLATSFIYLPAEDRFPPRLSHAQDALAAEGLARFGRRYLAQLDFDNHLIHEMARRCHQGRFEGAWAWARKHFKELKNRVTYWNQVGSCYLLKGDLVKAKLYYETAQSAFRKATDNPRASYAPVLNNLGVLYWRLGEKNRAKSAFEEAIKHSVNSLTPRLNIAQIQLSHGLAESALSHLRKLEMEAAKDPQVLQAMAAAHLMKGQVAQAQRYYEKLPRDQQQKANAGLGLVLVLLELGELQKAKAIFQRISLATVGPVQQYYQRVEKKLAQELAKQTRRVSSQAGD